MRNRFVHTALALLLTADMLVAQDPKSYPVVVTPGTPSIWSMEQAHYLLNRLRANNDSLQTTSPSATDLDPNATGGIRLDSLQKVLNVSAAYSQADAIKNQANLAQFQKDSARRADLQKQVDDLQTQLYQDQLTLANLQGEQARLNALQAITPSTATQTSLASIGGKITELTAKNTATSSQIASLNSQLAQATALSVSDTQASAAPAAPDKILSKTVTGLVQKAADSFGQPKLAASTVLDNFLRMQYEIVAKQLTLLRDDVGLGQRIVFLEMPTSISSADHRLFGGGGQDKLAQSWWRVTRIYRQYKKQTSPCWEDADVSPEGHSIDVVADTTKSYDGPTTESDKPKRNASETAANDGQLPSDALDKAYQKLEAAFTSLTISWDDATKASVESDVAAVKAAHDILVSDAESLSDGSPRKDPQPYSERGHLVNDIENSCSLVRVKSDNTSADIDDAKSRLDQKIASATTADEKKAAKDLAKLEKKALAALHGWLRDDLIPDQLRLYARLGGPLDLTSAFYSDVELDRDFNSGEKRAVGLQTGGTRAVELIPSQTAINVNQAHSLTSAFSLSVAFSTVFGFGAKGDYEQQHEKYDQFMEQEVFASGFGKGQATFGWTFGPTPGTRILNSGIRSTYAVFTVPDDTSALQLEGLGCAFPRRDDPPSAYPYDLTKRGDFHCGTPLRVTVGVPDQVNSGAFWATGIQYQPVNPGEKATVVIKGSYFSPQTTVLVDGHRLVQVVGVGKPELKIDSDNGAPEVADDTAISGIFEYVDHSQMVLTLSVPKNYSHTSFPIITLVSPSRATPINYMALSINGSRAHLSDADQSILVKNDPPAAPGLGFTDWQFYGAEKGWFTARLSGHQLSNLAKVWLNGKDCKLGDPRNDSTVTVTCPNAGEANWEFLAATTDKPIKTIQHSVQNPYVISITSSSTIDGSVRYDANGHPIYAEVKIAGVGFTPLVKMVSGRAADTSRYLLSYVSPTELHCSVSQPKAGDSLQVEVEGLGRSAAVELAMPSDKALDAPKPNTVTTTHVEKTVTKQ